MAHASQETAATIILRLYQFLPMFHQRIQQGHQTHDTANGNNPWKWGTAQQNTFEELKRLLAEEVVLAIPMEEGRFHVEADASEGAIGAVLSQEQDGKWCPVAFLSKSLTVTEQNYEIYDIELLAIMLVLDKWRHYLMGAAQDFEIWTDHQNLQYFRKPQKLNR